MGFAPTAQPPLQHRYARFRVNKRRPSCFIEAREVSARVVGDHDPGHNLASLARFVDPY